MRILLALTLALSLPATSFAQERAPLEWGPHGVGFRLIQARDSTRAFRPKRQVDGELVGGDTARPLQLGMWYPAATRSGDPRMTAGQFRLLEKSELDFETPSAPEAENQAFCDSPAPPDPIFLAEVIGNIQVRE